MRGENEEKGLIYDFEEWGKGEKQGVEGLPGGDDLRDGSLGCVEGLGRADMTTGKGCSRCEGKRIDGEGQVAGEWRGWNCAPGWDRA